MHQHYLTEMEHGCLSEMYQFIFGEGITVPNSCWQMYRLRKAGETFGSIQSRNFRSANIRAY